MKNLVLQFVFTSLLIFSSVCSSEIFLKISAPLGEVTIYQPDFHEVQQKSSEAKAIFLEAVSTTYRAYHRDSGSVETIEKWLRLKDRITLEEWLCQTYDDEYEEYLAGIKGFIYFSDSLGNLIGWLSHGMVAEDGDVYLSQCTIKVMARHQKIATFALAGALQNGNIQLIFPGVKQLKVITRKINKIARHLFTSAGYTLDESIDPSIYGDGYDDRYVGYRLKVD